MKPKVEFIEVNSVTKIPIDFTVELEESEFLIDPNLIEDLRELILRERYE